MTNITPSRAAINASLADVLAAISADKTLSQTKRNDLASAVRTVARFLGRPPESIPADPHRLARRLQDIAPLAMGITKGRWNNIRSLLNQALALTRTMLPGRHLTSLSPAWQTLYDAVPARGQALRVSRRLRWLSVRSVLPSDVLLDDLMAFKDELMTASLARKPEENWRELAWVWNKLARDGSGWPTITIPVPGRRDTYTFPWDAFPACLKADVDVYLGRLSGEDLLEDAPFRPVRRSTRDHRERQLRTFASALVRSGRSPESIRCLADIVALDAYKQALRFLLDRHGGKSSSSIEDMALALKTVAKHHAKLDATALAQMSGIVRKLAVKTRGMTEKNRTRLRPLQDDDTAHALLTAPARMLREAQSGRLPPQRAALLVQTAVAIEILTFAPIRLGNLRTLDLARHFVTLGRARAEVHVVIAGSDVKNGVELDHPLPAESAALIDLYNKTYRPLLGGSTVSLLFPGRLGQSKSMCMLRSQIISGVFTYTGLRVHPHLFRHIAAQIHLKANPGTHAQVSRLLGQKSIETAFNYYTGMETADAVRHFTNTVLALRHRKTSEDDK